MNTNKRTIYKSKYTSKTEVRDLMESIFTAELIKPSECLWLVAPWISDIEIFDNSSGKFSIFPDYEGRKVPLSAVLKEIAFRGGSIVVVTSDDAPNDSFKAAITRRFYESGLEDHLSLHVEPVDELHTKAITGDDFVLDGSMNFTRNGVEIKDERIHFSMETSEVSGSILHCEAKYGRGRSIQ